MKDTWTSHETWVYECQNCGRRWDEQYDVVHGDDHHGHEATVYQRGGQPAVPPWVEHRCPNCRSENIYTAPYRRNPAVPRSRHGGDLELVFKLRRLHAW
ncbi:hypothetical protein [Actinomadura atramentaria]|uniref:hypothetical protein n=1 Tax=Actinomadura atramentaria TaxID=1990 RepID=UPI00039C1DF1|nr:hypothetical protein [Actinomadura atramentaria]